MTMRGFFGIGIINGKTIENIGTLWRSANLMGASFIFTVGRRYKKQASDTMKTWRHVPLYNYDSVCQLPIPYDCLVVGVELHPESVPISEFQHPQRCIYLLGAEDHGLTNEAISKCQRLVQLPGAISMNVAVAGSIVMYDRIIKCT